MVACISGIIAHNHPVNLSLIIKKEWFFGTLIMGMIFISIFNLMAITTQKNGLSVAAVATKMSLIIPIIFGIIIYNESIGIIKATGIIIALIAVYLTSVKETGKSTLTKKNFIFPVLVFVGSGIIDTSLKFLETRYVSKDDVSIFSSTIFGFAGMTGICLLLYKSIRGTLSISVKNIIAGIILGVPNYFSIYFLIKALRYEEMDSSTLFTINNVTILLVSTLTGIIFFKERLTHKNWIGIVLAIISITLVAFSIQI